MTTEKPYYEIEFAAIFMDQLRFDLPDPHQLLGVGNPDARFYSNPYLLMMPVESLTPGEALQAITDHLFAEVNIPHHTADAVYCFTCHLFGVPNSQPAIMEMLALQQLAPQIYEDFGHLAKQTDFAQRPGGGAAAELLAGIEQPQADPAEPCPACNDSRVCQYCRGAGDDPNAATIEPQPCLACGGSGICQDCSADEPDDWQTRIANDPLANEVCPGCGAHTLYLGDDNHLHCAQCDWTGDNWLFYEMCPYCGSDNITDVIDYHAPENAPDILKCLDCDNTWQINCPPDDPDPDPADAPDLGPPSGALGACCICETTTGVRTRSVIMLPHPSPTPGRGWGCFQCGLPHASRGAAAVLCDACLKSYQNGQPLKFICTGYPAKDGRTPYSEMSREKFDHDMSQHPDAEAYQ